MCTAAAAAVPPMLAVKVLRKMDYTKLYDLGGMTEAKKKLSLPIVK